MNVVFVSLIKSLVANEMNNFLQQVDDTMKYADNLTDPYADYSGNFSCYNNCSNFGNFSLDDANRTMELVAMSVTAFILGLIILATIIGKWILMI